MSDLAELLHDLHLGCRTDYRGDFDCGGPQYPCHINPAAVIAAVYRPDCDSVAAAAPLDVDDRRQERGNPSNPAAPEQCCWFRLGHSGPHEHASSDPAAPLRDAAQAVVDAFDQPDVWDVIGVLAGPIQDLRDALAETKP